MNLHQRAWAAALTLALSPLTTLPVQAQTNTATESVPAAAAATVPNDPPESRAADSSLNMADPPPPGNVPVIPEKPAADTPVAEVETCISVTDKANAQDMQVTSAQTGKMEPAQLVSLNKEATVLWTQAFALCEGRAKARAQRNLTEDQKLAATLNAQANAGSQCLNYQKNGADLQEMAKKAVAERRWQDAASLFKRSENNWDLASERCDGAMQEAANQRREQAEIDGFNAEFCGPTFEKARTQTQKFRALPANATREEKQAAAMLAESWWRAALAVCKGNVQEIVKNNANMVARERGTPFVAVALPVDPTATAPGEAAVVPTSGAAPVNAPVNTSVKATVVTLGITPAATATPTATAAQKVVVSPPPATAPAISPAAASTPAVRNTNASVAPAAAGTAVAVPLPQAPKSTPAPAVAEPASIDLRAGDVRYVGQFVRDADSTTYSGNGQLLWDNGASYSGSLVKGKKQGLGRYQWSNGQTYQGDWIADQATGKAEMRFANGNQYTGEVVNGTPEGNGVMRYASGDFYKGFFKGGNPDGIGEYNWKNGQQYAGEWRDGHANGVGSLRFANGNVYQGEIRDGAPGGQGKLKFASGDSYEGQFVAGQPHGKGAYLWQNGDAYSGDWQSGKKQGQGVFTWHTGQHWEGEFDQDQQTANGKLMEAAK